MNDSETVPLNPRRVPLYRTLQRPPEEIAERFHALSTPDDVADLLELPWSQLYFITSRGLNQYPYRTFEIPKKGHGTRSIQAPHHTYKILQRKLLEALTLVYKPHPSAHGFVPGRSIITNARPHERARLVLNVDLEDFFPGIEFARVRGVFIRRFGFPDNVATVLARICCNTEDVPDHLPQGAPTSPIISNMICHSMDRRLTRLAKKYGLFYTRYADDLTFSTRRRTFPSQVAEVVDGELVTIGPELREVVDACDFTLNERKSRVSTHAERLAVTGLTVNDFANVSRQYVRAIRGLTNAWRSHGVEKTQARYLEAFDPYGAQSDFRNVLSGHLAFLRAVRGRDDRVYRRLYDAARSLDGDRFPALGEISTRAPSLIEAARDFPAVTPSDSRELRRQYLQRCVASATGTLWVIDPDLTIGVIQQIGRADLRVARVHFLSHDWGKAGAQDLRRYEIIEGLLTQRGVSCEWRLLSPRRQFHDRWIGDDSDWITMGPIAAVDDSNPGYSQNHLSKRPPNLDKWWSDATPVREGRPSTESGSAL